MNQSKHREAFEEFAEKAREKFGDSLKKLILYGSVAKQQETEHSDIDIYAVVENKEQKRNLEEMAFNFGIEKELAFSPNVKTEEKFEEKKNHPFTKTVMEEGVEYA